LRELKVASTMRIILVSLLTTILSFFSASAQLRVPRIFGDHMVLQREKSVPVWGWATPGEQVTVKVGTQSHTAKAAKQTGRWSVTLDPMPAGGPYELVVTTAKEKIAYTDVLFGEVWLCSGQSNMEWSVAISADAKAEIRRGQHPLIRMYRVEHDVQLTPQEEVPSGSDKSWRVCTPATVGDFTAVGYYFARTLREKIGADVPIGLVHSSWGGSQVEGWISREGLLSDVEMRYCGQSLPDDWTAANALLERRVLNYSLGPNSTKPNAEQEARYTAADYDYSAWPVGYAPGSWDWQGIWAFRGQGYMARYINVPADLTATEAQLYLGENDAPMEVWIGGTRIYEGSDRNTIKITIPANTLKAGLNPLVIKLGANRNPDWMGMGLHGQPENLRWEIGGEVRSLADNNWRIMPAWNERYNFARLNNNVAASLYNAMIHPLVPYGMRGVLWYQGESNAGRAYQYRSSFPLMIEDWRKQWDEELPFLFVQLSSYGNNESSNKGSEWAELREAQTMTLRLPRTGMAVTTDIGDADDIHPTNKQDVGRRLAGLALQEVYGVTDTLVLSPTLRDTSWESGSVVLTFDHTGTGLVAKDKFGYVRGFEVAADDKVFHYTQATIVNGNQILITHPEGKKPAAVRYAWSNAPTDANVFNSAGLPLGTFRTDDWPAKTKAKKFE
jgi:sialate O-acetylesterase